MADLLTREEHESLTADIQRGAASLEVTRSMARQFFINVSRRNVVDLTGISLAKEKLVVLGLLIVSIILLIGCLGLTINIFGWTALLAVPLTGIFWTIIAGFTSEMGGWRSTLAGYVAVMLVTPFLGESYDLPVALFATSILCYRVSHLAAQHFLTSLLIRSYDAFDMLHPHIEVRQNADGP